MIYFLKILEEFRNIKKSDKKRKGKEENHPKHMNVPFDLSWCTSCLSSDKNSTKCRRDKPSSIKGRKWEDIDHSEIDREHGDDHEEHLPCHSYIDKAHESSPDSYRSRYHSGCKFTILRCFREDEILEGLSENIDSHDRKCIGLIDRGKKCCSDVIFQ